MAETLWDGGPLLQQQPGVFPMGTDSILLADFAASASFAKKILDLGTGSGILPVLLLSRLSEAEATAVELNDAACALAEYNFRLNHLESRVTLIHDDMRNHRSCIPAGAFDLTVSNPPYFNSESGPAASYGLENARGDSSCSLEDLCKAAAWATKWGGRFCIVFRPERICELFFALKNNGFEPKRILPVHHDSAAPVNLILVEARRGGKSGIRWEKDLMLRNADGTETAEIRRIYHRNL